MKDPRALIGLAKTWYPIVRPALPGLHKAYELIPSDQRADVMQRIKLLIRAAQESPVEAVIHLISLYETLPVGVRGPVCEHVDRAITELLNSGE